MDFRPDRDAKLDTLNRWKDLLNRLPFDDPEARSIREWAFGAYVVLIEQKQYTLAHAYLALADQPRSIQGAQQ